MALQWITREEADEQGGTEDQILLEQSPDHYPEFGEFLKRELERGGGDLFFRGRSGNVYRVGRVSPTDRGDLSGIEICARAAHSARTLSGEEIDLDLFPFFEWLIQGVGGEWTLKALHTTAAIYKIPGGPDVM